MRDAGRYGNETEAAVKARFPLRSARVSLRSPSVEPISTISGRGSSRETRRRTCGLSVECVTSCAWITDIGGCWRALYATEFFQTTGDGTSGSRAGVPATCPGRARPGLAWRGVTWLRLSGPGADWYDTGLPEPLRVIPFIGATGIGRGNLPELGLEPNSTRCGMSWSGTAGYAVARRGKEGGSE